jgi:hypothetical protein
LVCRPNLVILKPIDFCAWIGFWNGGIPKQSAKHNSGQIEKIQLEGEKEVLIRSLDRQQNK